MKSPTDPRSARDAPARRAPRRRWLLLAAAAVFAVPVARAATGPVVWDEDGDGLDDRIGVVQVLGFRYSFENADTLARQRFEVTRSGGDLVFGLYVRYAQAPTDSDLAQLALLGIPVRHRLTALPALRVSATAAQAELARALPGVQRIEVVPYQYASTRDGAAALGIREPSGTLAPDLATLAPAADGRGIVVALLDSGVNDEPFAGFPGHEALAGRCLGGAQFTAGDSLLDTPRSGSMNPADPGTGGAAGHGTHMASIILGSGGSSGFARGVAPAARFVDVRVLGIAGAGSSLPEALDWCIANRTRDWGSADTSYRGIDVINLSLSSTDRSDGRDLASELCSAAAAAGIVVVASMGNDGLSGHVPSPAASDGAIAVGAIDVQRTARPHDDLAVAWDNTGPRASDGDADTLDELRPHVLAPGVGILAADGDLATNGTRYTRRTGTSPAAAFVSGTAACLLSAQPSLTPAEIADLLRATARRNGPGVPAGAAVGDPRWSPSRGFGVLDVPAAWAELTDPSHTQVRRLALSGEGSEVTAELTTVREYGSPWFVFERADDVAGAPGAFAGVDSLAGAGDASLLDGDDAARYVRTWPVATHDRGQPHWYRVRWQEQGESRTSTPVRLVAPTGTSVATVRVTIVHDALDSDVHGTLLAGAGAVEIPLPGSGAAVASDWVDGVSATGTIAWTFDLPVAVTAGQDWVPPSASSPWTLRVSEGGFVNRSGRIAAFDLIWHSGSGDVTYACTQVPHPTIEGGTVRVSIPDGTTDAPPPSRAGAGVHPNPLRAGQAVTFSLPAGGAEMLTVFDAAGRRVVRIEIPASASVRRASWRPSDGPGQRPGIYLARTASGASARLVILGD